MATPTITRRGLLVAGAAGGALLVGWTVWPRDYRSALAAGPGGYGFNAWLTIAASGQVTVAVPQAELGQGAYTAVAQMVADELGADWRTVGVEPALPEALQANLLLARESGAWWADERARRAAATATGGSSTVRGLEWPARLAGAEARDRLRRAAAARWDIDWTLTDARDGFVLAEGHRARFGELAEAAAALPAIDEPEIWTERAGRLTGHSLPRLDSPAKVDGQATFATDVRLPDMVHASVRMGPAGTLRLLAMQRDAVLKMPHVLAVVDHGDFVAVAARSWWAAERAADRLRPRWEVAGLVTQAALDAALDDTAAGDDWHRAAGDGSTGGLWDAGDALRASYRTAPLLHLAAEPLSATASVTATRAEVWAGSQAPSALRRTVADALDLSADAVTIYPTFVGGSFGRRATNEAGCQAAIVSCALGRPVQLTWGRSEDIRHDRAAPPARVRMAAQIGPGGTLSAWAARAVVARTEPDGGSPLDLPDPLDRAVPASAKTGTGLAYTVADWSLETATVPTRLPTGPWRGGGAVPMVFAAESFADELAARANIDPFSWRIEKLGADPRLAACLTRVVELGEWTGGVAGSGQGLAVCHVMGARVAVLAQVHADGERVVVDRLACAIDAGRLVNPAMVRSQVEGQLLFAAAAATGPAARVEDGVLGPPWLRDHRSGPEPEVRVALMPRTEEPGGVGSVVVPAVAPAIANALASVTGRRVRSLPLTLETPRAAAA